MGEKTITELERDLELCEQENDRLFAEIDKLKTFKQYVHARLDSAGIPVDPESSHKAAGCRIGGRLDVLIGQRDELLAACDAFINAAKDAWDHWDASRESKVGKLLAAMGGGLPNYRAELTAAHGAIAKAKGGAVNG